MPHRDWYQLHEAFRSIQGEGVHAGRTAVFIRLQGCPVKCHWCDAKLTWFAGGTRLTIDELWQQILALGEAELAVVTGGEPLIYDLDSLFDLLGNMRNWELHLETSGAYPYKGDTRPHWATVSPKYPVGFDVASNVLESAAELKYVVDDHFSPGIVTRHLQERERMELTVADPVVSLMPEGSPPGTETVQRTINLLHEHPTWRFSPRLQYAYPAIAAQEGDTNDPSWSPETIRLHARERRAAASG